MPLTREQLDRELGHFDYREHADGSLEIEQRWIDAHLTYVDSPWPLPLGWGGNAARIRCHKRVAAQLEAALHELHSRGLTRLVKTFDGAWMARLVRGGKTPSPHCWGHALDFNATEFPLGSLKRQDPQLVEVMTRHGFECGQDWQHRKDPMHFEAVRFEVSGGTTAPTPSDEVTVFVGGVKVTTGRLEGDHVVAPVAPIVKALGRELQWDGEGRRLVIADEKRSSCSEEELETGIVAGIREAGGADIPHGTLNTVASFFPGETLKPEQLKAIGERVAKHCWCVSPVEVQADDTISDLMQVVAFQQGQQGGPKPQPGVECCR